MTTITAIVLAALMLTWAETMARRAFSSQDVVPGCHCRACRQRRHYK